MGDRVIIAITSAQFKELSRLSAEFNGNMLIEQKADEHIDVSFATYEGSLVIMDIAPDGRVKVED